MLNDIKKTLGINNTEFDSLLGNYIDSAKQDLKSVGIASSLIDLLKDGATIPENETRHLVIKTAVITYVKAHFDEKDRVTLTSAYELQKDSLRRTSEYLGV